MNINVQMGEFADVRMGECADVRMGEFADVLMGECANGCTIVMKDTIVDALCLEYSGDEQILYLLLSI